ncbi:MAG TPA: hypothetical protein VFI95_23940 [Terriglobales bacterium]|nr:hypothetical protein [Terriglobales bacterium]
MPKRKKKPENTDTFVEGKASLNHQNTNPQAASKLKRVPGRLEGKISYRPDAFDPLTDPELKELGFED